MSRVAPVLVYLDKGLIGPIYNIEKVPGASEFSYIWIKDPKNKNPLAKPVRLEKPIENRHIKRIYPTETSTPGVISEIWLVYTNEENSLIQGVFDSYKQDVEEKVKTIKELRQKLTTVEKQNRDLTSGMGKAVASQKEAFGTKNNDQQRPGFNTGFGNSMGRFGGGF